MSDAQTDEGGHSIFHYRHQLRKEAAAGQSPLREGRKMQGSDVHRATATCCTGKQAENVWTDSRHPFHVVLGREEHGYLGYHTKQRKLTGCCFLG